MSANNRKRADNADSVAKTSGENDHRPEAAFKCMAQPLLFEVPSKQPAGGALALRGQSGRTIG